MAAKKKEDLEAEIWNAISAFEQILEAMPNDRASLEALSHAYEQIGDVTKAKEYFVRLGTVVLEEGDASAALDLVGHIEKLAGDDPDVQELISKLQTLSQPQGALPASDKVGHPKKAAGAKTDISVKSAFNMSEELTLAWNLLEAKELTQEEYASVVQDLTEMSASDSTATISVLHVLEARGFKTLERILGFLAKEGSAPCINLAFFEVQLSAALLLPVEFMIKRGTMIFDLIGREAMAVLMNPYDQQLRKDIELLSEKKCHFFMTLPSEFDQAMSRILKQIEESS